jgi:hypothetical protein
MNTAEYQEISKTILFFFTVISLILISAMLVVTAEIQMLRRGLKRLRGRVGRLEKLVIPTIESVDDQNGIKRYKRYLRQLFDHIRNARGTKNE